jgi:hypothetical protein
MVVGFLMFGQPVITRTLRFLDENYPNWMQKLLLEKCVYSSVPTATFHGRFCVGHSCPIILPYPWNDRLTRPATSSRTYQPTPSLSSACSEMQSTSDVLSRLLDRTSLVQMVITMTRTVATKRMRLMMRRMETEVERQSCWME